MRSRSSFPSLRIKHKLLMVRSVVMVLGLLWIVLSIRGFDQKYIIETIFFTLCVALAQIGRVSLPQGGFSSIDSGVIIAVILLFPFSNALAACVLGIGLGRLALLKNSQEAVLFPVAKVSLTASVALVVYYLTGGTPFLVTGTRTAASMIGLGIVPILVLVAAYFLLDVTIDEVLFSLRKMKPVFSSWLGTAKLIGPFYLGLSSLGILFALLYPFIQMWSALFFLFPLLLTWHALRLNLSIKRTYQHTISALSSAIEAQAPNRRGHAERVTEYSIGIARELGLRGDVLEKIAYAALLHDLGKLGLDEDSLDSILESKSSWNGDSPHAIVGAEILEQVDFLSDASRIVRSHHVPYSDAASREDNVPIGARIINVASRFDELTSAKSAEERLNSSQAISRLKKEKGLSYDPQVIRALIGFLQRKGEVLRLVG